MSSGRRTPAAMPTVSLLVSNMHCPSCCEAVTQLLEPMPTVKDLSVNLLNRTVNFAVDLSASVKAKSSEEAVGDVIRILTTEGGFAVDKPGQTSDSGSSQKRDVWLRRLRWHKRRREERKERVAEEDRRRKHVDRCEICQEEERQRQNGAKRDLVRQSPALASTSHVKDGILTTTLSIEGMTCGSCTGSISNVLRDQPGVLNVEINLLASSGVIKHQADIKPEALVELVEDAGFEASVVRSNLDIPDTPPGEEKNSRRRTTFSIEGMTCASCAASINNALRGHVAIEDVNIDVIGNKGTMDHLSSLTVEEIKEMIEDAGFDANVIESELTARKGQEKASDNTRTVPIAVRGVYCGNCISQINAHLASLPLVSFSPVSLASPIATLTYKPHEPLSIRDILRSLSDLAPEFQAEVVKSPSLSERSQEIQRREVIKLSEHLAVAVFFAIPTFIIAIVGMILVPSDNPFRMTWERSVWGAANLGTVVLWPLASIVQFGVGRLFYIRTYQAIRPHLKSLVSRIRPSTSKQPPRPLSWRSFFSFGSMDLLVTLSTSVSYSASIAMLILDVCSPPGSDSVGTYFDSSVFLIMFILLGRTIEAYAKSRTTDAVTLLGSLRPATALLVERPIIERKQAESTNVDEKVETSGTIHISEASEAKDTSSGPRSIPVEHLEKGDMILIPPGSLPPTDGIIDSGNTTFDESSLTGESRPVTKGPGDEVYTGTTNLSGAVTIRVTKLGGETMLEKIISAVSDASARKAPIEKLAERLTGVFVPIIVYLALLVLAVWLSFALTGRAGDTGVPGGRVFFAIEFAISVLVVACPCGIGLAVPCANAVGNGIAAKAGILASGGGEAWLAATKVSTVVFDKTGTLTVGKSAVTDERYVEAGDDAAKRIQAAVKAVEAGSTHPLASGLVEHLSKESELPTVTIISSEEISGRGVVSSITMADEDWDIAIGNLPLMQQNNVSIPSDTLSLVEKWSSEAKSVVLVAARQSSTSEYMLAALFSLSDPPRQTTMPVIRSLHDRGVRVFMLSGDNATTANAVGRMVGIEEDCVRAGVGPEGKADVVRELQAEERETWGSSWIERARRAFGRGGEGEKEVVMFVGDGLNDSVALAAADVSVAMGHGSQATLASADFVLLSSSLLTLPTLLHISKRVYNRERLNLFWAVLFNFVCIPFAAGVFYPAGGIRLSPVWSAVLMALSSVSVVMSSLALRWGM